MNSNYRLRTAVLMAIGCLAQSGAALAAEDELEEMNFVLEEISVSANKYSQDKVSLSGQDDKIDRKALKDHEISELRNIGKVSSSVAPVETFSSTYTTYTIRGLNSANMYEPGVSVYVDGVPQSFSQYNQNLTGVASVEIMKGPQGTIFGAGPEMGLISITTRNPVTDGNYGTVSTDVSQLYWKNSLDVGGALYEDLIFGKFGLSTRKDNGYIENQNGHDFNKGESYGVNGALYFSGGENVPLLVTVGGGYNRERGHRGNAFLTWDEYKNRRLSGEGFTGSSSFVNDYVASSTAYSFSGGDPASYEYLYQVISEGYNAEPINPKEDRRSASVYLKADYFITDQDAVNLTSTFANSKACDLYMPGQTSCGQNQLKDKQYTAEVRYSHDFNSKSKAVVGLNYTRRSLDNDVNVGFNLSSIPEIAYMGEMYGMDVSNIPVSNVNIDTEDNFLSLFSDIRYAWDNGFDAELGLRFQHMKSKADGSFLDYETGALSSYDNASFSDNAFDYKIAFGYSFDDSNRIYALTSTGAKAGGFSRFPSTAGYDRKGYDKETTYNYELGYHLAHPSGFDLNMAAFYEKVKDKQAYTYIDNSFVTPMRNVGDMNSRGFELDFGYRTDRFTGLVSGTYARAKNEKDGYSRTPAYSPKFSLAGFLDATVYKTGSWEAHVGGNGRYTSKVYFGEGFYLENPGVQGGYSTFDVYTKFVYRKDLEIKAYIENVTDKKFLIYSDSQTYSPRTVYRMGAPINAGISFTYNF